MQTEILHPPKFHDTITEVRYAETDQMGFAHHSAAVIWFELGRVSWLRTIGFSYRALEDRGILLPVVRMNLRYHAPGRFEDSLIIQTRIQELHLARVIFQNRVIRASAEEGREPMVLVEGQVELACIGKDGKVLRFPDDLKEQFKRELCPER